MKNRQEYMFGNTSINRFWWVFLLPLYFSCTEFLDVNENPNSPISENLQLSAKLPAALVATVNQETLQLNQLGALWGGYWGTSSEGANMFFNQKNYNGPGLRDVRDGYPIWETSYTNLLYYELIKEQAREEGAPFYEGIAKIMQGWHFLRLVDMYNNVPFEEALKGTKNSTPSYEPGEEVYRKSIDMISEGISDIQNAIGTLTPSTDDILFKGNRDLWIKFGNTIKLRALIRQSQTGKEAYILEQIRIIQNQGSGFLDLGQRAMVQPGYQTTAGKMNPFYENYYRNVQNAVMANYQDIRPTHYLLEKYKSLQDPRLQSIYTAVNGQFRGVNFGDPVVNHEEFGRAVTSAFKGPEENGGLPAGILKNATQPSVLMADFESLFLQAEAAHRGWLTESPEALYQQAIQASFQYLGLSSSQAEVYVAQETVAYSGSLSRIIEQKWLAMNSISSIEAWNDHRRLGMPEFPNSLSVSNPSIRPLRLMYPETERMTNLEQVLRQGNDHITEASVWWDK